MLPRRHGKAGRGNRRNRLHLHLRRGLHLRLRRGLRFSGRTAQSRSPGLAQTLAGVNKSRTIPEAAVHSVNPAVHTSSLGAS